MTTRPSTPPEPAKPLDPVTRNIKFDRLYPDIQNLFSLALAANGGGTAHGQLQQDIFALILSGFKRGGYFVEFGATNGVDLSNSYLLEKSYGWSGILAEPGRNWHAALHQNRSCIIDTSCVWRKTGEVMPFLEASEGEYSTLAPFAKRDYHAHRRTDPKTYDVDTITLTDLLARHKAPAYIDFLSIDTEGSEFVILEQFDYTAHQFGLITVEHNFSGTRDPIRQLMQRKGYKLAFENLSKWDDWYIPQA